LKAEVISEHYRLRDGPLRVDVTALGVIQAPKLELRKITNQVAGGFSGWRDLAACGGALRYDALI
jgi:hypothetical protein